MKMMGNSVSQQREFYARHQLEAARRLYNGGLVLGGEPQHQYVQQQQGVRCAQHEEAMRVATIAALSHGIKGQSGTGSSHWTLIEVD